MGEQTLTSKDVGGNWDQDGTFNCFNDQLYTVQDRDGNGLCAYIDENSTTVLKVLKISLDDDITLGQSDIAISTPSENTRIFLCLNRDCSTLYVGISGETEIHVYNVADMSKNTSILDMLNTVECMKIDKDGFLTVLAYNSTLSETTVDRYDTNNANNHISYNLSLPTGDTNPRDAIYFSLTNELITATKAYSRRMQYFTLSGSTYSLGGYYGNISTQVKDITMDIYGDIIGLQHTASGVACELYKSKRNGSTYTSSETFYFLSSLSVDSLGNYYFSHSDDEGNNKKLGMYSSDSGLSGWAGGNFSIIYNGIRGFCNNIDIFGYDISSNGCTGR